MIKSRKVCGVGVNDSNYPTQISRTISRDNGIRVQKREWHCPFYSVWSDMLRRGYCQKFKAKQPSYQDVTVCEEWHLFSNFKAWMETQNWEGNCLDKDLLIPGNKIYSPDTCIFIPRRVNSFILECNSVRGCYPIGVTLHKATGKYRARCSSIIGSKEKCIGYFETPEEAHQAWLTFKLEQAKILAAEQSDKRIADALISRYENYHKDDL